MGHRVRDEVRSLTGLNSALAETVAETLQALTSPNRLLILWRLSESPCSVSELAEAVGMEPSAVSHQLRILRSLGLVVGVRSGRTVWSTAFLICMSQHCLRKLFTMSSTCDWVRVIKGGEHLSQPLPLQAGRRACLV